MILLLISLLLAAMLGFAAHRAGVCTVAAVGEVLTSGTARTFLSFTKVVVWVMLVNGIAIAFAPELFKAYQAPAITWGALVGGLMFGFGAGLNGGCSFSTLSKLAQGELHFAITLPAFIGGATAASMLELQFGVIESDVFSLNFNQIPTILMAAAGLWAVFELQRLIVPALRNGVVSALSRKRYSLSGAAAFIGITSGFLYLVHGRWAYSAQLLDYYTSPDPQPYIGSTAFYLLLALLIGALISAASNKTLRINIATEKWPRSLSGGFLMGLGVWLVPGGNGKLMLQDLPHLSLHALVAYLAMIIGIAAFLMLHSAIYGPSEIVSCDGDECRIDKL